MAVVSRMPSIPQRVGSIRYPVIGIPGMAASRKEIVEEPAAEVAGEKVYVAVGKEMSESKSTLSWALHNSGGRKICILHVHEPVQRIPFMGTTFPVSRLDEQQVRGYREMERQNMNKLLLEYRMICDKAGVRAEVLHIEMESIEKGIVELISKHAIKKLVMGAAADKHYSKRMMEPKSKKAIYVRLEAPISCHIWFICKGRLVHTREGRSERVGIEATSLTETGHSSYWRDEISGRISLSTNSRCSVSLCSTSDMVPDHHVLISAPRTEELEPRAVDSTEEDHRHASPCTVLDGGMKDELYDKLELAMAEAENCRREAFEESLRRRRAEKDAIDAFRRAKTSERLYADERKQKKETEAELVRGKEELGMMRQRLNEVTKELGVAAELLEKYNKERGELQAERDGALRHADMLKKKQLDAAPPPNAILPPLFSEFCFSEIEEATNNFDHSLKIGEGGYGSIYKGRLRQAEAAIKILKFHSSQGPSEFQQEVNILSKLRHPNLVTLIGSCPESWILVYEYAPNGSLEDRLCCKSNTPPLPWQTRIRIASELCSVLIFLHHCSPHGIIHGDFKPSNILLDGNFAAKLSDFGISRIISPHQFSADDTMPCHRTVPKGTVPYMDPEFLATGELTPKSDVYSFGIVLLRLLTARAVVGLTKEVQSAMERGSLRDLLDPTAGEWPVVEAEKLAELALRCCEVNRRNRPDLASDVWRTLGPMRISCGASSFRLRSEEP